MSPLHLSRGVDVRSDTLYIVNCQFGSHFHLCRAVIALSIIGTSGRLEPSEADILTSLNQRASKGFKLGRGQLLGGISMNTKAGLLYQITSQ